jgi:hypothetical protein
MKVQQIDARHIEAMPGPLEALALSVRLFLFEGEGNVIVSGHE